LNIQKVGGTATAESGWNSDSDCTQLMRTIYGTKQAARQYWKTFIEVMKGKGYESTHAEPCLLKKVDENGTVIICVYVDDCILTGNRKAIDAAINDIETVFEIRRLGSLKEYIGCTIMDMPDGSKKLIQPDMIKKLKKEFGMKVSNERNATTPMGPGPMSRGH
jgi:phosphotransacetylase